MNNSTTENNDTGKLMNNAEWENRRLCIDGNCIGVIGSDGCCKVCGKAYDDELQDAGMPDSATDDFIDVSRETLPAPNNEEPSASVPAGDADLEWENRRLCSDGNCIGVIGIDGCCKVCRKPYTS